MAIQIEISCSNHQKNDRGWGRREEEIFIDSINDKARKQVVKQLEKSGWVVQFNGDHMDTYCSKKCAE